MRRLWPLALSLPLSLPACSAPDASAGAEGEPAARPAERVDVREDSAPDDVLGTLDATIDGQRTEFYIVAGDIRGEPYASAAWHEPDEERILLMVGGLDTPSPPLDTFEHGANGQPVSFGEYDGPVLSLLIQLTPEPQPFASSLPDDSSMSGLVYMSRASLDDTSVMYLIYSGSLDVSNVSLSNQRMSAEGTFSGRFRSMGTGEEIEITDGRFMVEGAPHLDEVTPESVGGA